MCYETKNTANMKFVVKHSCFVFVCFYIQYKYVNGYVCLCHVLHYMLYIQYIYLYEEEVGG